MQLTLNQIFLHFSTKKNKQKYVKTKSKARKAEQSYNMNYALKKTIAKLLLIKLSHTKY